MQMKYICMFTFILLLQLKTLVPALINQAVKKHVTDTIRPDLQSNSFQRPTQKEMIVASGCPVFIRQEQLLNGGFIRYDCIFL